jgi:parallel beta-helix repeat protein
MNMKSLKLLAMPPLVAGLMIAAGWDEVSAATLCVKPGGSPSCFASIQDAVDAASPGDTIKVAAGTYTEQVAIEQSLTLRGKTGATIKAPSPMVAVGPANMKSIVRVTGDTTEVTIDGFIITGPGDGGCNTINAGIKVEGGAKATIRRNRITEIRDEPFSGCQNGQGIWVGRKLGLPAPENAIGTATIRDNLIDNYQKGGIVVDNTGSSATIANNVIIGVGPTDKIAQNGIQVSRDATANVRDNEVSDNIYTPGGDASSGILLFGPGTNVRVLRNLVVNNDLGIPVVTFGGDSGETSPITDVEVRNNTVEDSTYDSIELIDTQDSLVSGNKITGSGTDGIFVDAVSTGNKISNNRISDSGEHDAHDDTIATDNKWLGNACKTVGKEQNQIGLCDPKKSAGP